jgi:CRISPR-associated protein Cas1
MRETNRQLVRYQQQSDSGDKQPKWDLLSQQIKAFKQFVYHPLEVYQPYQIR